MGEPGLPPLAPAFANAITRLTGKPLRQLPFNLA
jgi:isoquinoline 1-oxidoreductase beta subunit